MAARAEPFACLACYDATTARWMERAGVHVLLSGDSAAEVILGQPRTIHMPMEVSVALTAALKRGAPSAFVIADMPFMSYQASDAEAIRNAGRFMTEGLADAVKLEIDRSQTRLVRKLTRAGIPVCAHVGSLPQRAALRGGYGSTVRTREDAADVVQDAIEMERAGAVLLLIEAAPDDVAHEIVQRTKVPLIGIGAGPACHGQILVFHDLVGLSDHAPRFAEPVDALGDRLLEAGREWVTRVAERRIGGRGYEFEPEKPATIRTQGAESDEERAVRHRRGARAASER
ncbi:MAG: 3-methyl-2-oxobutanoate hydroxymethyltransferase [Phycisphaeraceae bacterium]|nr:3-methyl-2-oxobutanoate hydroxymethyltransferase [Phycisphaeraceae bacterium]